MSKTGLPDLCRFNDGVDCRRYGNNCERCGWNPQIQAQRMKDIKGPGTPAHNRNLIFTVRWR